MNERDETVLDEDVNEFRVDRRLTWWTWEHGHKDVKDEHQLSLTGITLVEITPCRDRLKREGGR